MKATKRILAMLVCVFVLVGCMSVSVYAADTASITIENQSGTNASVAGKTLNLFKVFNATVSGSNISYQWIEDENGNNKYESFFFGTDGVVGVSGTIHDVVAYINGLEDDSFKFSQMAANLHDYIKANNIQPEKSEIVPDGSTVL